VLQLTPERLAFTQLRKRGPSRFVISCPAREQLGVTIIEVLSQLFDDLGLARWLELQARQSQSDFLFPLRHKVIPCSV
jgi:hypothetical protein